MNKIAPARPQNQLKIITVCLFITLFNACSGDAGTPEEQVKSVMQQMEAAIEARDGSELFKHISDNYRDHKGNDRDALRRFAQLYLLRQQNIGMVTKVQSLQTVDDKMVAVEAIVVMGSASENTTTILPQLRADSQNVSAVFQLENDVWRLTSMSWDHQGTY